MVCTFWGGWERREEEIIKIRYCVSFEVPGAQWRVPLLSSGFPSPSSARSLSNSRRQCTGPSGNRRADDECAVKGSRVLIENKWRRQRSGRALSSLFSPLFRARTQSCFPWKTNGVPGRQPGPLLRPVPRTLSPCPAGLHQYPCARGRARR